MNLDVSNLFDTLHTEVSQLIAYRSAKPSTISSRGSSNNHIPIIENLTPQYMPPNPPAILISLLDQPIVPEHLRVEIEHLEGRMVHVRFGSFEEEEAVVVDDLLAAV